MPSSPTPRSQYSTYHMHCTVWASDHLTSSPLPVRNAIEALSVQLAFTACCLDPPVLDLWDHSLRPKVLYPVAGPPCRSGNLTRWNTRPCPAALSTILVCPPFTRPGGKPCRNGLAPANEMIPAVGAETKPAAQPVLPPCAATCCHH